MGDAAAKEGLTGDFGENGTGMNGADPEDAGVNDSGKGVARSAELVDGGGAPAECMAPSAARGAAGAGRTGTVKGSGPARRLIPVRAGVTAETVAGDGARRPERRGRDRSNRAANRRPPVDPWRNSRGTPDAPVVIVEYADFECPYCARAAGILRELVDSSDGQVRHVFRHFPVFDLHPHALTAALAAEAAGAHGRFWEMHDLLFANQDRLADRYLMGFARAVGVEADLVVGDPAQPYGDAVEADYADAAQRRVRGTPAIFVDGERYRGRLELGPLRAAVGRAAAGRSAAGRSADDRAGRWLRRAPRPGR
ncbi:protein-disulfide isomerase [Frankia sp. EI5c]|nr:protein-disulfide isomerase [Frankia sp. EI5c]